jgi:hypothetical protein
VRVPKCGSGEYRSAVAPAFPAGAQLGNYALYFGWRGFAVSVPEWPRKHGDVEEMRAQQAGHAPVMMLTTSAHVIEELAGTEMCPAEAIIRDARDKLVSEMYPPAAHQRPH